MSRVSLSPSTAARSSALPPTFACSCKADGFGSVCVHLAGELDLSTLPALRHTLREAQLGASIVSIDLQELTFIDCSALKVILEADGVAQRAGNRLILVRGAGQVDRVLKLTGILEQLEVVEPQMAETPKETTLHHARIGVAASS